MVNYKRKNKNANGKKIHNKKSSNNKKISEINKKKLKKLLTKQGVPKPKDLSNPATLPNVNMFQVSGGPSTSPKTKKVKETIKTKNPKHSNHQNDKIKKNNTQQTSQTINSTIPTKSTSIPSVSNKKSNGKQKNVPKSTNTTHPHIEAKSNQAIKKNKEKIKGDIIDKKIEIPRNVEAIKENQQFKNKSKKNKCKKPQFLETDLPPVNLNSGEKNDATSKIKLNSKKTTKNKTESININKKRKLPSQLNLQVKKKKKVTTINGEINLVDKNDNDFEDEHSNSESDSYIDQFFDNFDDKNGHDKEDNNLSDEDEEDNCVSDEDDIFDEESLLNDDLNPQESEDDIDESIKSNSDNENLDEDDISQINDDNNLSDEGSYEEYSAEEVISDENQSIEWSTSDSDDNFVNEIAPSVGNGMELIEFNPDEHNDASESNDEEETEVESDYFDDSYDNSDRSFDDNDNWSSAVSSEDNDDDDDDDDFNEFDSEYDSYDDDFDSDDITYNDFMDGQYETNSSDEDYEEEKKYVYVERGQARTYGLDDGQHVSFNSEEDAQIIEITNNDGDDDDSDGSCPELVPIDSTLTNQSQYLNETTLSAMETTTQSIVDDTTNISQSMICNVMKNQWEKCPISICNQANETNDMNNVSIENIMFNMSSKFIDTTTQIPNETIKSIDGGIHADEEINSGSSSTKSDEDEYDLDFNNISNIEKIDTTNDNEENDVDEFNENTENISILSGDKDNDDNNDKNGSALDSEDEWFKKEFSIQKNTQIEQYLIKTRFFNSLNSRQVLVLLKSPLHFHGSLRATLISGHAEIYGYNLELNETIIAYSVRGHSFIYFSPTSTIIRSEQNIKNIEQQLDALRTEFLHADLIDIIKSFDANNDALLLFERNSINSSIKMINTYMRQNIFPHIYSMDQARTNYNTESILHCEFFSKPKLSLKTTSEWLSMTHNMNNVTRCMVVGGKGVGKSTYVRHLINSNLHKYKRILLIDLDIGQPELFLPQTVNATLLTQPIIGPGYLQNKQPDRAYLFGEINVVVSPIKYLKCALKLIKYCKENPEYVDCPWIINTMGYVRGFGLELSLAIIKAINITDLVQIQGRREQDNFDRILDYECFKSFNFNIFHNEMREYIENNTAPPLANYQVHVYRSISAAHAFLNHHAWDMTPKDLRYATILSHLGNMLNTNSEFITDVKPICAPLDKLSIIVSSDDKVPSDLHSKLINANLVYLCSKPISNDGDDDDDDSTDNIIECYGIGIVRGVDNVSNTVYLLPSITRELLSKVTILAICGIPLPTSALLNINDCTDGTIPYVYNTDDFVGSRQVFQITHRPDRSFNGGKRNYHRGGKR